ncbi:MAG: hypothetical protein JWM95_683 [Gemmatimonadetes bacterium]|nr:hypothetical protein [Gemmatimonadota bacterium]
MLLLEVMLGTLLLGVAGIALVTLLAQTVETVRIGRAVERRTTLAVETLNRATLWNEAELESHIGRARMGVWDVEVTHPDAQLYTITVHDTITAAEILHTTVYRPRRVIDAH